MDGPLDGGEGRDGEDADFEQLGEDVTLDGIRPDAGVGGSVAEDGDGGNGAVPAALHVRCDGDGAARSGKGDERRRFAEGERRVGRAVELSREKPPRPGEQGDDYLGVGMVDGLVREGACKLEVQDVH